jgi:hypothetical protein
MTVVSNTSPLRYLIAAGQADLFARLFGAILNCALWDFVHPVG